MISGIWVIAFVFMLPTWSGHWGRFGLDTAVGSCSILSDERYRSPKIILFSLAFLVPFLCILVCYPRIYWLVRKSTRSKQQRRVQIGPKSVEIVREPRTFGDKLELDYIEINRNLQTPPIEYLHRDDAPLKYCEKLDECPEVQMTTETSQTSKYDLLHVFVQSITKTWISDLCCSQEQSFSRLSSRDRHLLKMILIIFGTFVVCYLPITISKICYRSRKYYTFHILAYLLIYVTTCINPLIYVMMSSDYRQAYRQLFTSSSNCRTSNNK